MAEGKTNGLIIDYMGIVKSLRQALADYTANPEGGTNGNDPTLDKQELIKHVVETMAAATAFQKEHGFELKELIEAESFYKLSLLKKAANAMCETLEIRKTYCTFATTLLKLWKLKKVAKDLLEKIKEQLAGMDHPFDKPTTKATLYITIRDLLYQELPESYSDESISYYRDAVYDYVSRQYGGAA